MHWNDMSSRWHEHYARGRPSYPVEAVRVADVAASSVVLEVGAGTGNLTRVLVDEFAEVAAVTEIARVLRPGGAPRSAIPPR